MIIRYLRQGFRSVVGLLGEEIRRGQGKMKAGNRCSLLFDGESVETDSAVNGIFGVGAARLVGGDGNPSGGS